MKQEEFALALNALFPGYDPEVPEKWAEFIDECIDLGQFAYYIPMEHEAAVEKWMDAIYAGLCIVRQSFGQEIARKVAELSCQRCAPYPGEMMGAALELRNGGDAERISGMMSAGTLGPYDPFFFALPNGAEFTLKGPEINITRFGVGLVEKRMEMGYLLEDGTVLLERERDIFGRYFGGVQKNGMYLQNRRRYIPMCGADGQVRAFQEVQPVLAQERETALFAGHDDFSAIYRSKPLSPLNNFIPLAQLQKTGASPLTGDYDLLHTAQLVPGADIHKTLDAYRTADMVEPGDIVVFRQKGAVTCWYVDMLAYSRLPGLLENSLNAVEAGVEQNCNQIDGIINNEAPKPSVRNSLKQFQQEADRSHGDGDTPGKPCRAPER